MYGSKVNSIYSINQDGIFVEAGYFYEPPSGVTTPPMFFSSWQDRLGQRHEYWSLMSSAHIGSYRAFAVLRTSGDDYNTMYNGWTMHTYPDTEMVSSWSQAGMERAYYSTDNGNLSIQYLQSKLYSTGNWSYWPGPVLGLNDNDGRYKPDTSALLGSAHWYKVVVQ
ncbi:MAG: hypothetical protein Q8S43_05960 [Actinomycetota bacterium]|nr:hypothetical protein [Actinomycetota bacterium]MDP3630483.1 hypothetical protein [Actinomycetota bacterium]